VLQTTNPKYITPGDFVHIARAQNSSRSTERKLSPCVEGVMRKILRVALTFMLAIAVAYPLLFWGTGPVLGLVSHASHILGVSCVP